MDANLQIFKSSNLQIFKFSHHHIITSSHHHISTSFMVYNLPLTWYCGTCCMVVFLQCINYQTIGLMNSNVFCPISFAKIDENVARINAAQTVLLLGLYFATQSILPVLLLLVDFVLRGSGNARFSPLAIVSKQVQKIFAIAPKTVNAGPKLFAARIGIVFSAAVVILHLIGLPFSAFTVAGVFAFCAFLEAAFSFCVACRIYPFVYKLNLRFSGQ